MEDRPGHGARHGCLLTLAAVHGWWEAVIGDGTLTQANLPRGDLGRPQWHQHALRALMENAANSGVLSSTIRTYEFPDTVTRYVSVDDTLDNGALRALALDLKGLRSGSVDFGGAPVSGLGREGAQSVVYLNNSRAAEMWSAFTGARSAITSGNTRTIDFRWCRHDP